MCTGRPFQPTHNDYYCRSSVDAGQRKFLFEIDVRLQLVERLDVTSPDCFSGRDNTFITTTYTGDPWPADGRGTVERRFREDIQAYWDRTFKLVPTRGGGEPLNCGVDLNFLHDDRTTPHLRAEVIFNPQPDRVVRHQSQDPYPHEDWLAFRANCWALPEAAARDMALDWNGTGWDVFPWVRLASSYADARSSNPPELHSTGTRWLRTHHNYLAHEFGHYLQANHVCHVADASVGWCESPQPPMPAGTDPDTWMHEAGEPPLNEYCEGSGDGAALWLLMAAGDVLRAEDGGTFQQRIREVHHFECDKHYVVELMGDGMEGVRRTEALLDSRRGARAGSR